MNYYVKRKKELRSFILQTISIHKKRKSTGRKVFNIRETKKMVENWLKELYYIRSKSNDELLLHLDICRNCYEVKECMNKICLECQEKKPAKGEELEAFTIDDIGFSGDDMIQIAEGF